MAIELILRIVFRIRSSSVESIPNRFQLVSPEFLDQPNRAMAVKGQHDRFAT